jgi:type I protein arginine methyltransferase
MVNDVARNNSIERSIASLELTGRTVVEIGAGTGLIALLFAKYGAARIVTCEMNANLASVAQRVIDRTPYRDRIEVIHASSTEALECDLLPHAPDVIFTETLDCGVVGEGFTAIVRDIGRLSGPNTIVLPRTVTQVAVLTESESIANLNRATRICGFDLGPLNDFATGHYFPVRAELHPHSALCEPTVMRAYRYVDCPPPQAVSLHATRRGMVHGLLSWFSADFGAASVVNAPYIQSHWHQAFHPLPEPIRVEAGDVVTAMLDDEGHASAWLR